MKVLEIYGKKDFDRITVNGKSVNKIMEDFWKYFPHNYRNNYDKNIENLELWRVDEHHQQIVGEYSETHNIIMFSNFLALIHELMHLASRDLLVKKTAFIRNECEELFEGALVEGYTEFLASMALNIEPTDYEFEVFSVAMLSNINGIFEPYFIPNFDKFMSLFPRKKDILSLMYALSFYSNNYDFSDMSKGREKDLVVKKLQHSVRDVIDSLISIQVSLNRGLKDNKMYGDEFLSLISNKELSYYLKEIWKDYFDYANNQVNKRVLRRN